MPVDFQQIRSQIQNLGSQAVQRQAHLQAQQARARDLLAEFAARPDELQGKLDEIVRSHDPSLRCARPWQPETRPVEPINAGFPAPDPTSRGRLLAADGSQINLDRHSAVMYALINVGVIEIDLTGSHPPRASVQTELFHGEELQTPTGTLNENLLALRRDVAERRMLADLALDLTLPVITLTDGPLELWGTREQVGSEAEAYSRGLAEYLEALQRLADENVATAGYVDKPGANLVIRLLEIAMAPPEEYPRIRQFFPLRDTGDRQLFAHLLQPGERSAVFALQARTASQYRGQLGLHFFYLNVGRARHPWLARVEIPAWVARSGELLDSVHGLLLAQSQVMGARPYPYILHRAHETAVVSRLERDQITALIVQELHQNGLYPDEISAKQFAKNQPGRARYGK